MAYDVLDALDEALGLNEATPEAEEKRRKLAPLLQRPSLPAAQLETGEVAPASPYDAKPALPRVDLKPPADLSEFGGAGGPAPSRNLGLPPADLASAPQEAFDAAMGRARRPAYPAVDLTPPALPAREGGEVASVAKAPAVPALMPKRAAYEQLQAQGGPKLTGWKRILDIVGQILGPGIEQRIPGSPGNYELKLAEAGKRAAEEAGFAKADVAAEEQRAQARKYEAEAALKEQEFERGPKEELQDAEKKLSDAVARGDQALIDELEPRVRRLQEVTQRPAAEKSTKEQIQAQINAEMAKPAPDRKVVKGLQDRLKAIDPLGEGRLNITLGQKGEEDRGIEIAAQALASGDLTRLRDISSFRGGQRMLIYARAKEINPQFNTAKVDRQIKMLESYTTGKQGDQLQSFGTFLEHAAALAETMDGLKGATPAKILNRPINWLRQNVGDDAQYQRVLAALDPVQKEFESYLLNNRALYIEDRATVDKIINEDLSPNQLMGALEQMGHTVQARFNEANRRFKNTMGANIEELVGPLTDEAIAGAKRIGVKVGSETAPRDFGPAPAGKKEGDTGTLPDGTKVVVRNGRIVAQ